MKQHEGNRHVISTPGCRLYLSLLPGEEQAAVGWESEGGHETLKILVTHPTRRPCILWRDVAGVLREEVLKF